MFKVSLVTYILTQEMKSTKRVQIPALSVTFTFVPIPLRKLLARFSFLPPSYGLNSRIDCDPQDLTARGLREKESLNS